MIRHRTYGEQVVWTQLACQRTFYFKNLCILYASQVPPFTATTVKMHAVTTDTPLKRRPPPCPLAPAGKWAIGKTALEQQDRRPR